MTERNPFEFLNPESIDPVDFKRIFVKGQTSINALENREDFFVIGSRGSGKSMQLHYLEISHQLLYYDNELDRFFSDSNSKKYIGIMVHIKREGLDTDSYELLIENNLFKSVFVDSLSLSDIILAIICKTLDTIIENQILSEFFNERINQDEIINLLNILLKDIVKSEEKSTGSLSQYSNIQYLKDLLSLFEKKRIKLKQFLMDKFQDKEVFFDDYYFDYDYLHKFILNLKSLLKLSDFSFYVLLDNGDDAKSIVQKQINSLVAERDHNDICFKIGLKKGVTWNYGIIDKIHDYKLLDLDEIYSTKHASYHKMIEEIMKKRFEYFDIDTNIEDFIPESPTEKKRLEEIRIDLREHFEKEYEEKIKAGKTPKSTISEYISNMVNKYAQAKLFTREKTGKSYAGFTNIVHLSSGNVRSFLNLCARMLNEERKRKGIYTVDKINLKTQNDIIKQYSDEFMDDLQKEFLNLEKIGDDFMLEKHRLLYNLIEALGKYYYERLRDHQFKTEPRIFTFTLKDSGKNRIIDDVIRLGVNKNYFQEYWYSSKAGGRRFKAYPLNRRLCPRYSIDHTSFRGRIELTSDELNVAMLKGILPRSKDFVKHDDSQIKLDKYFGV